MAGGRSKKERPPQRAATRSGGFTGLPHVVQDSAAYRHLSLWGRAVLLELIREFNGYNNGRLWISFDQLCDRLRTTNRRAIKAAFTELFSHGLVDVAAAADRRHHKAREYRLTFVATTVNEKHVAATEEYWSWTPALVQKHGNDASPRGGSHGDDASPRGLVHGDDVSLRIAQHRRKPPFTPPSHGDDVSLHIVKPCPPALVTVRKGDNGPSSNPPNAGGDFFDAAEAVETEQPRACEQCGGEFELDRPDRAKPRRFCSETCRKRAERARAYARRKHESEPTPAGAIMGETLRRLAGGKA